MVVSPPSWRSTAPPLMIHCGALFALLKILISSQGLLTWMSAGSFGVPGSRCRCSSNFILSGHYTWILIRGLSTEEAESLLKRSVRIATEARDKFWASLKRKPAEHNYNRALVAASIGSYGAYLADGSEYSGNYGLTVTLEKLKDFHRRRLQVLVEARPDLLAFETIPNKLEAQVYIVYRLVELLDEENVEIPSWICFSSVDGKNAPSGERFEECLDIINKSSKVFAVGINCAPPHFVLSLIQRFKELTAKAIVVYPNSGETWDGIAKRWLPSKCFDDEKFELFATKWRDAGAKLIGGCCRTTPSTIRSISKILKERS
ncbi:UNVERIFIED_CONTAM: Homocysteine S-methyltransferase 1 [Sesamum angustifolium]|uniref:Homocysteine S-methyltransferase 1 n=1 Tax=Sesamum angustifolium TaxID=2727405 RepID=A0AAW2M679_9LAMI